MENLQTTYLGLQLRNPLIAGSATYEFSIKYQGTAKKGVSAIVIKSLFEEQIQMKPKK